MYIHNAIDKNYWRFPILLHCSNRIWKSTGCTIRLNAFLTQLAILDSWKLEIHNVQTSEIIDNQDFARLSRLFFAKVTKATKIFYGSYGAWRMAARRRTRLQHKLRKPRHIHGEIVSLHKEHNAVFIFHKLLQFSFAVAGEEFIFNVWKIIPKEKNSWQRKVYSRTTLSPNPNTGTTRC